MDINVDLLQWFGKFWIKRFLVEQLKIILLLLSIIDNIWGAALAYMQVISKFYKGVRFLLRVINIFSKYAWVIPLKDKKRYYNYQCLSENFKRI